MSPVSGTPGCFSGRHQPGGADVRHHHRPVLAVEAQFVAVGETAFEVVELVDADVAYGRCQVQRAVWARRGLKSGQS